jgi:hypothetical protein
MATDKLASDTQVNELLKDNNPSSDEDDEDDLDLGASALPRVNFKSSKDFEMINLDADEEDADDAEESQRSEDRRKKRYRKKKRKKEELAESSSEDESGKETALTEDINPVN